MREKRAIKRKGTRSQKEGKNTRSTTHSSIKGILWPVLFVTIFAIVIFIYFNRKAAERRAETAREHQAFLEDEKSKITLSCKNLLPLENSHYSLYYTSDQGTSLITNFNINEKGNLIDLNGNELQQPLRAWNANNYILKVVSPEGKETVFMSGKPTMEVVNKNLFLQAQGNFVLATPSDDDPNNEAKGIWFGSKEGDGWKPSLSLPAPPEGWRYAAWLFINNKILLIGKFISGQGEDSNKTFYTGKNPSIPGEDFFINLPDDIQITDIRVGEKPSVWITLEPDWYNGSYPFPVIVLGAELTTNTQIGTLYKMTLVLDALPYCTLTPSSWLE